MLLWPSVFCMQEIECVNFMLIY